MIHLRQPGRQKGPSLSAAWQAHIRRRWWERGSIHVLIRETEKKKRERERDWVTGHSCPVTYLSRLIFLMWEEADAGYLGGSAGSSSKLHALIHWTHYRLLIPNRLLCLFPRVYFWDLFRHFGLRWTEALNMICIDKFPGKIFVLWHWLNWKWNIFLR